MTDIGIVIAAAGFVVWLFANGDRKRHPEWDSLFPAVLGARLTVIGVIMFVIGLFL